MILVIVITVNSLNSVRQRFEEGKLSRNREHCHDANVANPQARRGELL